MEAPPGPLEIRLARLHREPPSYPPHPAAASGRSTGTGGGGGARGGDGTWGGNKEGAEMPTLSPSHPDLRAPPVPSHPDHHPDDHHPGRRARDGQA